MRIYRSLLYSSLYLFPQILNSCVENSFTKLLSVTHRFFIFITLFFEYNINTIIYIVHLLSRQVFSYEIRMN